MLRGLVRVDSRAPNNESAFDQFTRSFDHLRGGQTVVLIEVLRDVGGLAELAANSQGLHLMRNAGHR